MNAPLILPQLITTRFGYPFKNKQDQAITDPQTFYDGLAFVQSGHYPLGVHGYQHTASAGSQSFRSSPHFKKIDAPVYGALVVYSKSMYAPYLLTGNGLASYTARIERTTAV